ITIPQSTETSRKLILDDGNGECVLYTSSLVSGQDTFSASPLIRPASNTSN
ncbi:hypothetical protein Csa_001119, partial [Cucumis sativus]